MTGREYLRQARALNSKIKNLEEEVDKLREEQAAVRSAWPDGQPHGTGTTDPTGVMASRLADKLLTAEHELLATRDALLVKRMEILKTINKVERAEYNRLLYLRYVQCLKWEDIAEDMHYVYQWVAGPLHDNAVAEVEKILSLDSN